VLPISNPANLVVFGERMPHLFEWLRQFALPSVAAIVVTYAVLCLSQYHALAEENIASRVPHPTLGRGGGLTAIGIAAIGVVLLTASALDVQLGLPTFICSLVTAAAVLALNRQSPWRVMKGVSWSVLPLVAGLFVMVEALLKTCVIDYLNALVQVESRDLRPRPLGAPESSPRSPTTLPITFPWGWSQARSQLRTTSRRRS
jgi:arsenical pump membrane protein